MFSSSRFNNWKNRFENNPFHTLLDTFFTIILFSASLIVAILILLVFFLLIQASWPVIQAYGFSNIFESTWNVNELQFGMLNFIAGTLVTSFYAIIIAIPVSIGIAIFINEYVPLKMKKPLTFLIEIIAAIPSVIIGYFGLVIFGDFLNTNIAPLLWDFPFPGLSLPFLGRPSNENLSSNVFTATVLLIIMVIPIITSISTAIIGQVNQLQKEAAYALGATSWEMSKMVLVPQARRGIIGASILGLGRALGETMAVTMVIGDGRKALTSIFDAGNTLTSSLTNQFAELGGEPFIRSAILEIGLVLLILSVIVNIIARLLIGKGTGTGRMEG